VGPGSRSASRLVASARGLTRIILHSLGDNRGVRKEGRGSPDPRDERPTLDERAGARRPEASTPPANLPRYRLGLEIARGGMGRVVEATDTLLGRIVAVKEALATDPEALRRFARETRITARLEHPSIVPVHDAGRSPEGSPYYVMRKVSGRPLEDLVRAADSLEKRLALLPHLVAAAQAVAHAHQRGVLHRDLKPSNILVGDLGETVVIDWGLAKVIDEPDEVVADEPPAAGESLRTRIGTVFGTPGFMSPEQLRGDPVDARSDVYALGATLYHLLSQEPPHASRSADDMMAAALAGPPQPIADLVPGVPAELSTIVDKALVYDDRIRYADAGALVEDLQRFLTGQLVASHRYSRRERLLRFVRKNRVAVMVSAAAAIALAIGAWIAIGSVIRERDRADTALREALDRNETLTIYQAQSLVGTNPTAAIALLKTLPPERREVRMLAVAARRSGVAWGLPAATRTASVVLSADGLRALTAGSDGGIREYDLRTRKFRIIANVGELASASWLDNERAIAIGEDNWVKILDAKTGELRRQIRLPERMRYLHAAGRTAWWSDLRGKPWRLDVDDKEPTRVSVDDDVFDVHPSPDGKWVAWSGRNHLWITEAAHPEAPPRQFANDMITTLAWSPDAKDLAFSTRTRVWKVRFDGEPTIQLDEKLPQFVYNNATYDGRVFAGTVDGISVLTPGQGARLRRRTDPMITSMQFGYRGTMVAPTSADKVYVLNDVLDADIVLSAPVAAIGFVAVSQRSPYIVASAEGLLLVWNLDDVLPQRLEMERPVQISVIGPNQMLAQSLLGELIWHDLDTGEARPQGSALGPILVRSPREGGVVAITVVQGGTSVRWWDGRPPLDLGNVVSSLFRDRDHLLYATEHDVNILDLTTRRPVHIATVPCKIILIAHRATWLAARCSDGTLWRHDLATGADASKRVAMTPADSIVLGADGSLYFLDDKRVRLWQPSDAIIDPIELHRAAQDINPADDDHMLVVTDDSAGYLVDIHTHEIASRIPTGSRLSSLQVTPEMTTAVDQGGTLIGLDLITGVRWTIGRGPEAIAFPQLTSDGNRVIGLSPRQVLAWPLDHPTAPADVARWLDDLTNARAPAGPTALTWQ
jgi:eukaryotic-like serine/threonine-protein kinase